MVGLGEGDFVGGDADRGAGIGTDGDGGIGWRGEMDFAEEFAFEGGLKVDRDIERRFGWDDDSGVLRD